MKVKITHGGGHHPDRPRVDDPTLEMPPADPAKIKRARKVGLALSSAQVAMLRSIEKYGDPHRHLSGRSKAGGASGTLSSLWRLDLITRETPLALTEAGRTALRLGRA